MKTRQRNFRCRLGEIDLVMDQGEHLVFVEVRYRRQDAHGNAAESVSSVKRKRLAAAAAFYLARNPRQATRVCRFDVISIAGQAGHPEIEWIRNAFETSTG